MMGVIRWSGFVLLGIYVGAVIGQIPMSEPKVLMLVGTVACLNIGFGLHEIAVAIRSEEP